MKEKKYTLYILLGLLYPAVKVIYYIYGFVYLRGIMYGVIAGILTIMAGILAFKEYKGENKPIGHRLAVLLPLLIIPLTPLTMIVHLGAEALQIEKISVFVIFEGIAIAQLVLGILMFRGLIFKRGTDELAMPGIGFAIMRTVLTVRNIFRKPEKILRDVGIKKGQTVLDYGCGIGNFCTPLSEMVGDRGMVYALDVHPLAIKAIEREIEKKKISNIRPILSNMDTGLSDESVDVILLYDVFQMITDKEKLLKELHRVLKPDGILSATAEHLDVDEFMSVLTKEDLFTLVEQKGEIFTFRRD